jgi:sodium-dependent phosphate cotransporter
MGANIGTTVTNTIVSLTHITHGDEYRRAYSGAVVHDIFNLLSVMVLFPLQLTTGFLSKMALYFEKILENMGGLAFGSPIKIITKPLIEIILNACGQSGWVSAGVAILLLIIALRYMVKILKSMVLSRVEKFFQRYVFKTTFRALMLGLILTGIVQSSSITTSLIVPLVGAGVLSLNRVYPFTLGANIGTTVTAIMAAMVTVNSAALALALAHLLFNICGIIIWLP